jgi:hypothetical protein
MQHLCSIVCSIYATLYIFSKKIKGILYIQYIVVLMPIYICKFCNYKSTHRSHFEKHMETKRHIAKVSIISDDEIYNIEYFESKDNVDETTLFSCTYCQATYKHHQSLYRHIKYSCKKSNDEDLQELVRLLNKEQEVNAINTKRLESLQSQIEKLTDKLQMQTIYGDNINGNSYKQQNTIQLLNYNKTDYDFLEENDYIRCFMDNNHCVKKLIEKVHFNKKRPENMNVYVSSMKGKYVMVYRDNKWQIRDSKRQVDDLYESNEFMLEQWYDEFHEKYPEIINSFTRYLKNKENDNDLIKNVKKEILLMLYNKRDMIEQARMAQDSQII